jgi:cytochrome b
MTTMTMPSSPVGLVFDLPQRVFHWLIAGCFAGAWLSAESEQLKLVHVTLGLTVAALVTFRLVWGFIGSRHARFANFVRGPGAAWAYLAALRRGRAEHHDGHNPAGGLAIIALLSLAALTTALGWAAYCDAGGLDWGEVHEAAATAMLVLVGVHLSGVVVGSLAHRENLVRAMITGRKRCKPDAAIGRPRRAVAAALAVAVLAFWAWQWHEAPRAEQFAHDRSAAVSGRSGLH